MTYQLLTNLDGTTSLVRTNDDGSQTFIPQDPANSDYQTYLLTPVAVTPLSAEQLAQQATDAARKTAIDTATANLTTLIAQMGPAILQGKADLVTLSTATITDPAIVLRILEGELMLAQGVSDILTILELIL